ncbi:helix-turn-helix domain-containing protein [Embleya scabrispora]|uniref:helix-turn-helix domain-containing protein n=1 Tax=Embleya scabrispora TaxID=159449 RepID=UPI0003A264BB|nr:helix-turn-helix transcriptional regulator [Embleya scabrispora]MYS85339.1 helix-turn-helix transcriptional regulator [Streptomyces sp. SID5474]
MLDVLGLDDVAESVYRAMLARPDEGVSALAARLGLSEVQLRSALDTLSTLALLRPSAEHDGRLHAVSPDVGMEVLLARQEAELVARQHRIDASRAAAARLIAECADLRPAATTPGVEQLIGLDRIRDRLVGLTREVHSEVLTFAPGGGQTMDNMEAAKPLDGELLERGVLMRTLYLDSVRYNPPSIAYADWLTDLGGEVRTAPTLPVRMIIVDRTTAVVPIDNQDTAHGAVVLTGLGTLTALCALFDTLWDTATPLGKGKTRDTRGLTTQESETLRLLGQGLTDDAIANRLGVSGRTARRIAADIMDTLGARSRFQAGAEAARRSWL